MVRCPCGCERQYRSERNERIVSEYVEKYGEDMRVMTPRGAWWIPRHYIALHGLAENEVPELAEQFGWKVA